MDPSVRIFRTPYELAEKFAEEMVQMIKDAADKKVPVSVALSGGSTPELLFSVLGDHFSKSAPWDFVNFFWGDERCVPPVSPESNFGMTFRSLFKKIKIPQRNIHRIYGEHDPSHEAIRYSDLLSRSIPVRDGFPVFDLVLLGLGEDGHTASIFPDRTELFHSDKICEVSLHPVSRQKRITITGRVINNAERVRFLVTGSNKAEVIKRIIGREKSAVNLPASLVVSSVGNLGWLLDSNAGSLLKD
ncbi:MAG: 6-phosphogluconolactonase [Bacteroidetes bacterium GWE2_41_25]|nr:MAG: 6-phosphogluconolactonase [Bacteroidetes bacterium GWA2_40_15]OFX93625.1 MAG: 6-phosphogluconolactonase [Bacteroidetes bacterium GWC2_40_22]OFY01647.1 MAG: 6-phosphogluconolactonase [Bacteroidetes bacterium GWE2_41_25]OFY60382.1 MAG: 6-phosphogluconolactonase [Bacteroidetes bacterium GWF2_41_9]HAM10902.1 6-phosphogluconolactonase [Bacteroidales bacterium]